MIEHLAADTDMCLTDTQREGFLGHHKAAKELLAQELGVDFQTIKKQFDIYWERARKLFNVQPDWLIAETTRLFKLSYPSHEGKNSLWTEFQRELDAVYTEPVHLYPDVVPTFNGLKKLGVLIGCNSQAEMYWTNQKMFWNPELAPFLVGGMIYNVRSKDPKTAQSWIRTLDFFRFPIDTSASVGDSLPSDVISSKRAGIPYVYYLCRPDEPNYLPSKEGEIPPGVIVIESLLEILADARAQRGIYLV